MVELGRASNEQLTTSPHSGTMKRFILMILLLVGVGGWFFFFDNASFLTLGPWPPAFLGIFALLVAGAAWIPPVRSRVIAVFNTFQFPYAIAAGAMSSLYLFVTAHQQRRPRLPYLQDEFSYLIQAHQLAVGRLWMPAHPIGDFFDSFQLIVQPVYASIYFPGTAILYVPGIWLHIPAWVTSLAIAGGVIALLHRIVAELVHPLAGWIAVLLMLACPMFRTLSTMTMAQLPLLLFALTATIAWLKWRANGRLRWAGLMGAALGLAAITRPVDALCFAAPIGAAVILEILRNHRRIWVIPVLVLSAAPFLCIQLIANRGITGNWFETPFRLYADRDYPGTSFGFHAFDPSARPVSTLAQKQQLYLEKTQPLIEGHQVQDLWQLLYHRVRLALSLGSAAPFPLLVILLPVALAGFKGGRWMALATLPLFVGLYVFYVYFFPHYVVVVAPAVILGILIGTEELGALHPGIGAGLTLFIIGVAGACLPQLDQTVRDQMFDTPLIGTVNAKLATLDRPAVVLFRYSDARNVDEEPVFNSDVAWPDDARIIRAHDLGPQDWRIFNYYAQHQPDRVFYLFDEATRVLTFLGSARDLGGMSR